MPIVQCKFCSKDTYKRPSEIKARKHGVFCSHFCGDEWWRNQSPEATFNCRNCGKKHRRTPAQVRREKTHFCSVQCRLTFQRNPRPGAVEKAGYRIMNGTSEKHKREHRWVMEQFLGRPLKRDEQVHHLNGNRLDNRIENLIVMSNRDHHLLHQQLIRERKKTNVSSLEKPNLS